VPRTFRATLTFSVHNQNHYGKVPIDETVVRDLGLKPGETVRASMRGTEFTGKLHGSLNAPGLLVPIDIVRALGLRDGQGVRLTVHGRA
jgi:antitoxin component of MazEF toxin-antitoxin module